MADEKIFLNEASVFVSNSRVVIAGTTYSLANLTSVRKGKTPPNRGCALVLITLGSFTVLVSLGVLLEDVGNGTLTLVIGGVAGGLGLLWFRSVKPTFHVVTASSSGETQALSSMDEGLIDRVVHAISEAVVYRG